MAKAHPIIPALTQKQIDRFWSHVDKTDITGCWNWTGSKIRYGYGHFRINNRIVMSHRIAYFIDSGNDPLELCVLHECDNTSCCNPSHLFLGTHLENMADRNTKCRQHSKLSVADVIEIRRLYGEGKTTQLLIGRSFNISDSAVSMIVTGHRWGHVGGICTTSPNGGEAPSFPATHQITGTEGAAP